MVRPLNEVLAAGITPQQFHDEIVTEGQPVVLRGAVRDWPATHAGTTSPEAIARYLLQFDGGVPARAMVAPAASKGRFFYNEAISGFNFRSESLRLDAALDVLLDNIDEPNPTALAVQSLQLWEALPGFDADNRLGFLPPSVEPRAWLGNRVVVAAHFDSSENIACVVCGKRQFTLFPPAQVANLYPGPFELTPAGPTISMVDFDKPDLECHPRFTEALENGRSAELEPGDAIYIPYLWWHHVRSTEPLNLLINYWWTPPSGATGHPMEALVHAIAAVRALPPHARAGWEAMFDHYVFGDETAGSHLPEARRGILADRPDDQAASWVRNLLAARYAR